MEKINVTLREETLHDIIYQLRQHALPILKTIIGAIKNGEWDVEILCTDGEMIKIQNQKEFVAYLKKKFSSQARNRLIQKAGRKNTK